MARDPVALPTTKGQSIPLSVTDAARSFSDVVNRVRYLGTRFVLTKGGKPVAELGPIAEGPSSRLTGQDLRARLGEMPRLGREEAALLAEDLERARRRVVRPEGE